MNTLSSIVPQVLTNPKVIIAAIVIFVYMDIACAIVRYRKKPKPMKRIPFVVPQTDAQQPNDEQVDEEE